MSNSLPNAVYEIFFISVERMSKFEKIKELNKLPVFHITDEIFSEYGNIIDGINAVEYIKLCKNVEFPESGSVYAEFENTAESEKIRHTCFGGVPTQIGICYGHNSLLNALEWHICNEVNIALTDMVVIFAKRSEIKENRIGSDKCKAFFVPKGTAIEVYSTTLHYCPCETDENGFAMVVGIEVLGATGGASKASDKCSIAKISENNKDWCNGRGKPLALRKAMVIVRKISLMAGMESNPHRHGSE